MDRALGCLDDLPRARLGHAPTPLEEMPNLAAHIGGGPLYVKRDDCTGLALGGNKVRQLEFYLCEAVARRADTVLITGAVQSNFARLAAAAARKLGMECHIQHEERVAEPGSAYRLSGNVLLEKMLGATLHAYPKGEDEAGADRRLGEIADQLQAAGRRPYIIHLAPGHPPLGALGYVAAARELVGQMAEQDLVIDEIVVASGSGHTHGGLPFGLRALGCMIPVTGIRVRRAAEAHARRIPNRCPRPAHLEGVSDVVQASRARDRQLPAAPGLIDGVSGVLSPVGVGARLAADAPEPLVVRVEPEPEPIDLHRADALLERFLERPADCHDLSDTFHLSAETSVRIGKFLESPAWYLHNTVIDSRLETRFCLTGDVI